MPNYTAAQFRDRANQMVGVPYILGAEWPASCVAPCRPRALDCSELVEGLFRENGTPIGDLAASQYDKASIHVSPGQERVGDLVFLRNNRQRWNGIGHVAVLTAKLANGDWEIIESKGRAFGTVRTTLSFWKTRRYYTGVRRFPAFDLVRNTDPLVAVTPLPAPDARKRAPRRSADLPTKLQQDLAGAKADGVRGPRTIAALKALQRRVGANPDGKWGPDTAEKYLLSVGNLRHGSRGDAVKLIQWIGGESADGIWGARTGNAVAEMQGWAGLTTDRVAGPRTKRAITV